MTSPLVSQPPYGTARSPRAESGLPQGPPAGKGVPLDDHIPGYKTYVKPVEETQDNKPKDESIYRVDSPRDMGKTKSPQPVEWGGANTTFRGPGEDATTKTKYPYRDDKPNAHNASGIAPFVLAMWHLQGATDRQVDRGTVVVAATSEAVLQGLNPKFVERSKSCNVTLKRADIPNLRWMFAVDCGNGVRAVRVKATRKANVTQFSKMDISVACSCPAWRWQGPEFHAKGKGYQDPNTPLQGTASTPDIRDPERQNKVCKHVAAVLAFTKAWSVAKK